jgi:hypothetical protein
LHVDRGLVALGLPLNPESDPEDGVEGAGGFGIGPVAGASAVKEGDQMKPAQKAGAGVAGEVRGGFKASKAAEAGVGGVWGRESAGDGDDLDEAVGGVRVVEGRGGTGESKDHERDAENGPEDEGGGDDERRDWGDEVEGEKEGAAREGVEFAEGAHSTGPGFRSEVGG